MLGAETKLEVMQLIELHARCAYNDTHKQINDDIVLMIRDCFQARS